MDIHKDRWQLNRELSVKKQEGLHILLQAAGFVIHEDVLSYKYKTELHYTTYNPSLKYLWNFPNDKKGNPRSPGAANIYITNKIDATRKILRYDELISLLKKCIENEHKEG